MEDGCIIIIHEVSRGILLSETVFNSDNLFLHVLKAIACQKTRAFFKALVTKRNRSSYVQVTIFIVKSQSARDVQSHSLYVKVLDFASFRRSYVREFELSHSKLVNRIIKVTHAHNLHVKMLVFRPFTIRTLKKGKFFTTKFCQTILRNHLGFIITSAIKLCFMQRQA